MCVVNVGTPLSSPQSHGYHDVSSSGSIPCYQAAEVQIQAAAEQTGPHNYLLARLKGPGLLKTQHLPYLFIAAHLPSSLQSPPAQSPSPRIVSIPQTDPKEIASIVPGIIRK